jgi:hypothetical protein
MEVCPVCPPTKKRLSILLQHHTLLSLTHAGLALATHQRHSKYSIMEIYNVPPHDYSDNEVK